MSEIVKTYLLDDPGTAIPMERDEFYAEQIAEYEKTGRPTRSVDIIMVLMFNSHKQLMIQKRSGHKFHNPGLLDKSVGGHIQGDDNPDYTVMVETVQELQTPSIVLKDADEFSKTLNLLKNYLNTIAVVRHIDIKIRVLGKIIGSKEIQIADRCHIYFGVYDGRTKPVDQEAHGILYYTIPELEDEMKKFPDTFTNDLHVLLPELQPEIDKFFSLLK